MCWDDFLLKAKNGPLLMEYKGRRLLTHVVNEKVYQYDQYCIAHNFPIDFYKSKYFDKDEKVVDWFEEEPPAYLFHIAAATYEQYFGNSAIAITENPIKPRRGFVASAEQKQAETRKCLCDLHTVIMRTGCVCGGQ